MFLPDILLGGPNDAKYRHDALGRRILRYTAVDGKLVYERYFYDGADVVADYDGRTGELRALYVTPFLDENLLKEDFTGPGPVLAWYTQDGLGSVRQLVVGDSVMNSYAYTAWGVPLQWHEKVSNRYTFTAREYNPETSNYYYRLRWYAPILGRMLTRDPIVYGLGPLLYPYAHNNPVIWVDPMGMWCRGGHEVATKHATLECGEKWGKLTVRLLQKANMRTDNDFKYDLEYHAMRQEKESWMAARRKSIEVMKKLFRKAVQYAEWCRDGFYTNWGRGFYPHGCRAVAILGILLHLVQDIFAHYVPDWRWSPVTCVLGSIMWAGNPLTSFCLGTWLRTGPAPRGVGVPSVLKKPLFEQWPGYPMTMKQHGFAGDRSYSPERTVLVMYGPVIWLLYVSWIDDHVARWKDFAKAKSASVKTIQGFIAFLRKRGWKDKEIHCCVLKVWENYIRDCPNPMSMEEVISDVINKVRR